MERTDQEELVDAILGGIAMTLLFLMAAYC